MFRQNVLFVNLKTSLKRFGFSLEHNLFFTARGLRTSIFVLRRGREFRLDMPKFVRQ